MSEIGQVTDVDVAVDEDQVYVDVAVGPGREHSDMKFRQLSKSVWVVPEVGDLVEVSALGSGERVAHSVFNRRNTGLPSGLSEGDVAIKVTDGTVLKLDSETGDVTLTCDGDLNLDAANIYVGDESNAEPVATGSHTHPNGDGGTTGQPSDTTEHEME